MDTLRTPAVLTINSVTNLRASQEADMTTQIETRTAPATELRVAGDGRTITGYAAVFGSDSLDMGYTETIRRGCFADSLKRDQVKDPVLCLWNHNSDMPLGTTANGSLELEEDSRGLKFKVRPGKTSYAKDAREAIAAGLVQGCSFGFTIQKDKWTDDGLRREIIKADLREVSPCVFPAYRQTEVQARNAQRSRQMNQLETLQLAARELMEAVDNPDERKTLPFAMDTYDRRAKEAGWPTIADRGLEYILTFFRTNGANDPEEQKRIEPTLPGQSTSAAVARNIDPQDDGTSTQTRDQEKTSYELRAPSQSKDYRSMFGIGDYQWRDKETKFFEAVFGGRYHPDLQKRAMNEGLGSDGGFLVPTEYSEKIHAVSLENELVIPRAFVQPMLSNEIKLPGMQIGDHSSNLFGGFVANYEAEAATLSEANPKTRQMTLLARKLTGFLRFSNELLTDTPNGEKQIIDICGKGLAWYRDKAFLKGTGSGQPLGILNADCLVEVDPEVGQASGIVYQNLTAMLSRLYAGSFANSCWVCHQSCIPDLLGLSIPVGTGGSYYQVLTEGKDGQFKMLTRPVIFTEKSEILNTKGDICLFDFSQYVVGLRAEMRIDTSQHIYFTTDESAARISERHDGQPLWDEALTLQDGSTTVSPFVVLGTRS